MIETTIRNVTQGETMRIGIIGAGMVGGAIEHCFDEAHELFIHDPARGTNLSDVIDNVDFAYIAVPTRLIQSMVDVILA